MSEPREKQTSGYIGGVYRKEGVSKGIEEFSEEHKPSPFVIRCKCGGMARDISGIIKFAGGGYYPLPGAESYFANIEDSDCGVPILK